MSRDSTARGLFLGYPKEVPLRFKAGESFLFTEGYLKIETIWGNKTISVEVAEKRICLTRTNAGFFALDEKCPHQNLPITHGGFCENEHIVCPFHRYSWNLKTGREIERRENNIQLYPVEERKEGLFIGFEKKKNSWFF